MEMSKITILRNFIKKEKVKLQTFNFNKLPVHTDFKLPDGIFYINIKHRNLANNRIRIRMWLNSVRRNPFSDAGRQFFQRTKLRFSSTLKKGYIPETSVFLTSTDTF